MARQIQATARARARRASAGEGSFFQRRQRLPPGFHPRRRQARRDSDHGDGRSPLCPRDGQLRPPLPVVLAFVFTSGQQAQLHQFGLRERPQIRDAWSTTTWEPPQIRSRRARPPQVAAPRRPDPELAPAPGGLGSGSPAAGSSPAFHD